MKIFIASLALAATASAVAATPVAESASGCIWLTSELRKIQKNVTGDRLESDGVSVLGPHQLMIYTPVGEGGPLPVPVEYTIERANEVADLVEKDCQ